MIKRQLGETLAARRRPNRTLLVKAITHNLMIVS